MPPDPLSQVFAVPILHGTGGSGSQFLSPLFAGELYGAGQPLDTATHYVILPDNIGHGRSSKPSDGLRARFPHYAYEDMVAAQYRLVTEGLHVNRSEKPTSELQSHSFISYAVF